MKRLIFFLFLLPLALTGQNYLYEITPINGTFRVLVTDDSRESFPRDILDYGNLDTAGLRLFAYNVIEEMRNREAAQQVQIFLAQLRRSTALNSIAARIPLDYAAHMAERYANAFDGQYQYQVRGTATNFPVYIAGTELRRQSNNNLLATLTPQAGNWIRLTAGENVINLYQFGVTWVGTNAQGQIVTLRRL
jgi:hypothetical protein